MSSVCVEADFIYFLALFHRYSQDWQEAEREEDMQQFSLTNGRAGDDGVGGSSDINMLAAD